MKKTYIHGLYKLILNASHSNNERFTYFSLNKSILKRVGEKGWGGGG